VWGVKLFCGLIYVFALLSSLEPKALKHQEGGCYPEAGGDAERSIISFSFLAYLLPF
jgi:hypothetical protein